MSEATMTNQSLLEQIQQVIQQSYQKQGKLLADMSKQQLNMQTQLQTSQKTTTCYQYFMKELKEALKQFGLEVEQECQYLCQEFFTIFRNVVSLYQSRVKQLEEQLQSYRVSHQSSMITEKNNVSLQESSQNEQNEYKKVKIADVIASYQSNANEQSDLQPSSLSHQLAHQQFQATPLDYQITELFSNNEELWPEKSVAHQSLEIQHSLHNISAIQNDSNIWLSKNKTRVTYEGKENKESWSKRVSESKRLSEHRGKEQIYSSKLSGLRRDILGRRRQ